MSGKVIDAVGIAKSYGDGPARVDALKPTDFAVRRGEFVMVAGPSGSGKSTLLAIVSGLLTPSAGKVRVLSRDIAAMSGRAFDDFRLEHFGFVFQGFHLLPALSALEQVSIVLERQGLQRPAARRRAQTTLEHVGLAGRMGNRPAELSGGEKQRVAIARTLVKNPPILLLDEATSALDTRTEQDILATLHRVSTGRTSLSIAHRLSTIADADRIFVLNDGALAESGSHSELLRRDGLYADMWNRQASEIEDVVEAAE